MKNEDIVIVAAKRTPMGSMLGNLSSLSAPVLGAHAFNATIQDANLEPQDIDEVIAGCVLQAGIGQAPARQAAIKANIPFSTPATTINKMCGSGMKAIMLAHDAISCNNVNVVLAGGIESMSNAPYLLNKARNGYRLGNGALLDHMFIDGLEDAYDKGRLMGCFAEDSAKKYKFTREQQDKFAETSMQRAILATENGAFNNEIAPVTVCNRKEELTIDKDEGPSSKKLAKISKLKPAFAKDGSVTAANSSSIADGAASLLLMRQNDAKNRGITPLARIIAHASHAQEPKWFTTAPSFAINKLLVKTKWRPQDVDLYEINEAFAVVAMICMQDLNISHEKVNINGGACALGHPIGASGARIVVSLIHALIAQNKKRGIAALCIGGGEATAIAVEIM